ncbi:tuberoinfundibular peptide of 39 residues isoform X2 [Microtus oregoni]|uniref:tuberoinfundibular peptide of 39 residues isoform X2 n=1 Tax=Microtus oregoni TaxID=111838 RepID=UPI001BB25220|nr:tuberoinfundibular peptide of 39 residues isoform X2 [Microtus oregoni]
MTISRSCPLCPQVMETCQVSRSPRERRLLLLLLLLLVPWGTGPASGVALPLTGVFSLALADDAAFRERARLLAALERRRWLDSYMQKLLLLDAP